jgi:gliding motility-associated lipoprotein GldH
MHQKIVWFFSLLLLASCSQSVVFEQDKVFDDLIWNRFDLVEMEIDITDENAVYDLRIKFMHTESYPLDQIAMNLTLYFPNGGMRSRDYDFRLQNEKLEWSGTSKGHLVSHEFPVILGMRFPEKGITRVRIENKLTKFNNPGIAAVGLIVEKTK